MTNKSRGEDECGQPGDLVSWAEADWKVEDTATMIHLEKDVYDSCRKKSSVSVFQFYEPHRLEDCMQHCQKIVKGKSPSVGSFEEWERVIREVELFTTAGKVGKLAKIWLAVTEGDVREAESACTLARHRNLGRRADCSFGGYRGGLEGLLHWGQSKCSL